MMSLKNAVISVVASVSLIGCAINVSPSAFFHQDSQQQPIDTTKLHAAIQNDKTAAGITRIEVGPYPSRCCGFLSQPYR